MKRRIFRSVRSPVLALLAAAVVWSCADQPVDPTSALEGPISPTVLQRDLALVIDVQERHTPQLMRVPNVVGTAVALGADGEPVVTVLARNTSQVGVPKQLEGVPVEVLVSGEYFASPPVPQAKPTCGKGNLPPCPPGGDDPSDPTSRFPRPVPIGVSTGHPDITAGTIGARVTDGTNVWALSNNHVYANMNAASIGDAVIQPGTYDGGASPADDIGTLAAFQAISFGGGCSNTIDAAIASTTTSLLGNSTPSGGYGTPKSATVTPAQAVGKKVKKYGRTTGQTSGTLQGINATVSVNYGTAGIACFTGQLIITPGSFSAGGDSGSLIVMDGKGRDKALKDRPVGLLFAGSSFQTIANPIDPVLNRFGVSIDGS